MLREGGTRWRWGQRLFIAALAAGLSFAPAGEGLAQEPAPAPGKPDVAGGPDTSKPDVASGDTDASSWDDDAEGGKVDAKGASSNAKSAAAAEPGRERRVEWDPRWPRFRVAEYIATPLLGVAVFAARAIPPSPENWRDVSDFDAGVRNVVRMPTLAGRNTADDASDLILTLMVNQLLVDATLVAWWGHDRPSVGYQMALIDLEALALTGAIQALVSATVSRWRPFRATCVGPVEQQTQDCQDNKQYTSFFSGHTSGAFTAAGLMCMHHLNIPLYGGGAREGITCAASFLAAATVGYLRMAADQHFMTDVLVGAAVGTLSGLGVPWLLHYRGGAQPEKTGPAKRASQLSVRVAPTPMGLVASGEF